MVLHETRSSLTYEQVTYGGSGCPQGTVGSIISEDGTTMTLIFDSYVASMGQCGDVVWCFMVWCHHM